MLIGSAYADHFYDTPAALSQKYGVEVDAGWTVLGQLNVPNAGGAGEATHPHRQPDGRRFRADGAADEQRLPPGQRAGVPALSLTPIAIYRTAR